MPGNIEIFPFRSGSEFWLRPIIEERNRQHETIAAILREPFDRIRPGESLKGVVESFIAFEQAGAGRGRAHIQACFPDLVLNDSQWQDMQTSVPPKQSSVMSRSPRDSDD